MQVWRNRRVLSEQTSDSSASLNVMFLSKYSTVNSIFHISIRINCNRISEVLLYFIFVILFFQKSREGGGDLFKTFSSANKCATEQTQDLDVRLKTKECCDDVRISGLWEELELSRPQRESCTSFRTWNHEMGYVTIHRSCNYCTSNGFTG
jgi:hypothetical protein